VGVCAKTHGAEGKLHVLRLRLDEFDQLLASVGLVLYRSVEHVEEDQGDGTCIRHLSLIREHVWGRRVGLGNWCGSGAGSVCFGLAVAELSERADILRMSILGDLEIILAKIWNRVALGIGDDHINQNGFRGHADGGNRFRAGSRTGLRGSAGRRR